MNSLMVATAVAAVLSLSACGYSTADRTLSGAGLGAAGGAALGAIAGSPGTGAIIGGVGGAAIGGLTSPEDVQLGKPLWR